MFKSRLLLATILLVLFLRVDARERMRNIGSSEVLEFVQPVAELFARHWSQQIPSLEITGRLRAVLCRDRILSP
jgi:hypothetical protein